MSEANGEYPPVYGSAWDRLMAFLADDADMTPEQVRADLEAEGVDVDAFLKRVHDTIERCTQNAERKESTLSEANRLDSLVVLREVVSETWRRANPRHCPVVLRDGDGKSVGACWHYLRAGVCPSHGQIYQHNSVISLKDDK